jgi:hypothetical protein
LQRELIVNNLATRTSTPFHELIDEDCRNR